MADTWKITGVGPAQIRALWSLADESDTPDDSAYMWTAVDSSGPTGWAVDIFGERRRAELRASAVDLGNLARALAEVRGEHRRAAVSLAKKITREVTSLWSLLACFGLGVEMAIELRDFMGDTSCRSCRALAESGVAVCACGARFR